MGKQKTTEQFISDAIKVHGHKYNYAKAVYQKSNTSLLIVCPEHGDFEQTPNNHLRGKGCAVCGRRITNSSKLSTTSTFIEKANTVHKDKYDYSEVIYVNTKTKVTIICPVHGPFEQIPGSHLQGKGCIRCSSTKKLTTFEFITKAQQVHGTRYDYSKVVYTNARRKIQIVCHKHGSFQQKPTQHLSGNNCPKCSEEGRRSNTQEFIEKAKLVQHREYDYSKAVYLGVKTKLEIICPHHGPFWQRPDIHLTNHGCPSCVIGGFNPSKPGILYYIRVIGQEKQSLYKIGITNKTIEERFKDELSKIEIIKQRKYQNGQKAYAVEQKILKYYREFQYTGPPVLVSGNTELFTKDILNLTIKQRN